MAKVEIIGLDNLDRIMEKTGRKLSTVIHEFSQDLSEAFVSNTPVITGNLKSHWFLSIGAPSSMRAVAASTIMIKPEVAVTSEMAMNAVLAKPGDTIYFVNGAAYAAAVEYGTVKMAPRAFVRSVVARASQIADATIARIAPK